jgi:hypothetical protein
LYHSACITRYLLRNIKTEWILIAWCWSRTCGFKVGTCWQVLFTGKCFVTAFVIFDISKWSIFDSCIHDLELPKSIGQLAYFANTKPLNTTEKCTKFRRKIEPSCGTNIRQWNDLQSDVWTDVWI